MDKSKGLYDKYFVSKVVTFEESTGTYHNLMPVEDWVFVLNPTTDPGAVFALHAYAVWARQNGYDQLSDDITAKLGRQPVRKR